MCLPATPTRTHLHMNAATPRPRASKETLGCAALWSLISCGVLRRVWRLKHTTDKLSQTARSDKSVLGGNKRHYKKRLMHYKKRPICPVRQVRWRGGDRGTALGAVRGLKASEVHHGDFAVAPLPIPTLFWPRQQRRRRSQGCHL